MRHLLCGLFIGLLTVAIATVTADATERAEGCSVTGLITDQRGTPVPHAVISIFRDGKEQEVLVTASSDRSGKFALSRLAPGVYRLLAAARGFQTLISERTALLPGQTSHLNLMLRPAPDTKTSGVNPVKYQNRRHRGIFNTLPTADAAAEPDWRAAALVGSSGYDAQLTVDLSPELEVGTLLRRDWEGRATTVGGALRYTTERHRVIVHALTSEATTGEPGGTFRRYEVRAADAWQAGSDLQLVYGFDYIQLGRTGEDAWLPRLAAHWQPCRFLQFHTALTTDGRAAPDWAAPEAALWASDFPTPPQRLALGDAVPSPARNLRAEVGVAWRPSSRTAVKVFAYHDRLDGHPFAPTEQAVVRLDGRAQGGGLVVAYRPHRRLTVTTGYAVGDAPAADTATGTDASGPTTTYHVVTVVAETVFPVSGARFAVGYRGAVGNPIHAIDPFTSRLPFTESGLSFTFIHPLPVWFLPPGRWEAVVEGRNLDERRGEITGLGAAFGFPQRRMVRGGLRVRF